MNPALSVSTAARSSNQDTPAKNEGSEFFVVPMCPCFRFCDVMQAQEQVMAKQNLKPHLINGVGVLPSVPQRVLK